MNYLFYDKEVLDNMEEAKVAEKAPTLIGTCIDNKAMVGSLQHKLYNMLYTLTGTGATDVANEPSESCLMDTVSITNDWLKECEHLINKINKVIND